MKSLLLSVLLVALVVGSFGERVSSGATSAANADARAIEAFKARITKYQKVHEEEEHELKPLPSKAEASAIQVHAKALAARIQHERRHAKPGDIFTREATRVFTGIIRAELAKPTVAPETKEKIQEGNPKAEPPAHPFVVKVNAFYPEGAPVSTVPANILLKLPELPKEMEYRFVGKTLVLRDSVANIIVDYIPNAVP